MSKIPEDIWHVAEFIVADKSSPEDKAELIAIALLAERERCADIADKAIQPGIPSSGEWMAMGNFAGTIRDAIRATPVSEREEG